MVRAFNIITYTWLRYLNCRNNNFLGKSFSRQIGSWKVLKKIEKKKKFELN